MFSAPGDLSPPKMHLRVVSPLGPSCALVLCHFLWRGQKPQGLGAGLAQEGWKGPGRRRRAGGGEELGAPAWSWEEALDPLRPGPSCGPSRARGDGVDGPGGAGPRERAWEKGGVCGEQQRRVGSVGAGLRGGQDWRQR